MRKAIHNLLIFAVLFGPSFCCCEVAAMSVLVKSITGGSSQGKKTDNRCCCCKFVGLLKVETNSQSDQLPIPSPDPCACSKERIDLGLIGSQPVPINILERSSNFNIDLLSIEMPDATIVSSPLSTGPPIPGGETRSFMLSMCHRLNC